MRISIRLQLVTVEGLSLVMQMLGRLNLFNMAIEECWMKDSHQADHLVEGFYHTLTRMAASGLVDHRQELIEARVRGDVGIGSFTPTVIVQVLDSLALKVDDWKKTSNRDDRFLHEIAVMVWETDLGVEQLTWERQVVMRRRYCSRLLVVLDRPFLVSALHAFKAGHLAMAMNFMEFNKMVEDTKALERSIDEVLESGADVWLGLTAQQRTENIKREDLKWLLRTSLYDPVDGITARLWPTAAVDSVSPLLKEGHWTGPPFLVDFSEQLAGTRLSQYLNQPGLNEAELDSNDG